MFDPDDDIAELAEVMDRPRQTRKAGEVDRVLALLDELETGGAGPS